MFGSIPNGNTGPGDLLCVLGEGMWGGVLNDFL